MALFDIDTKMDKRYLLAVKYWNKIATLHKLQHIRKLGPSRKRMLSFAFNECSCYEFRLLYKKVNSSSFLTSSEWFSFDWLFKDVENVYKVLEGLYDDRNKKHKAGFIDKSNVPSTKLSL